MRRAAGFAVIAAALLVADVLQGQAPARGPRFYPDDPLIAEPTPLPVAGLQHRALSAVLETVSSNLKSPGQRHPSNGVIPADGMNTLGEVMDGDWYVNRHSTHRMTIAELQRGSGNDRPPDATAPWQ